MFDDDQDNVVFCFHSTAKPVTSSKIIQLVRRADHELFLVFTHVTCALTTVAIRHVGAQTNALNREITVRT